MSRITMHGFNSFPVATKYDSLFETFKKNMKHSFNGSCKANTIVGECRDIL